MAAAPKKRARNSDDVDDLPSKKLATSGSVLDTLLPITTLTQSRGDEDFRIIAGSYERILYGIDCFWETKGDAPSLRLEPVFIIPAHTGVIRTVAVGGHFLASGSSDEIIRLYDIKRRKEYGSLGGHQMGDITNIQFHGKYMFSASEDHTICLWRTKDWEYLKTLKGHKGRVNALAIHPSGKIALSVSSDKTVILWNLMTAHKASVYKLGREEGLAVSWNAAGDQYAIMFDRQIQIYDTDAKVITTLEHRSRFLCMYSFRSKGEKDYVVSGHEDKTVRFWDAASGECVAELTGHKMRIKALATISSKDKQVLISISSDGVMKCWDAEAAVTKKSVLLGEYDAKSRITCCTVHAGFAR